jgi:SAM-dependent methyltransferase
MSTMVASGHNRAAMSGAGKPIEASPSVAADDAARVAWEATLRGQLQRLVRSIPVVGRIVIRLHAALRRPNVRDYWEERYRRGGDSGSGSFGRLSQFKAEVLNDFVRTRRVESVVEFGCGDGHQLELAQYPSYVGVDISESALRRCRERFANDPSKRFLSVGSPEVPKADCTLSLDVILHLVDDATFETYMRELFAASTRYVVIYSSNFDERFAAPHVRHRHFTRWVEIHQPEFSLESTIANRYPSALGGADTSNADFFIFRRRGT